jgi:hypothetical protein
MYLTYTPLHCASRELEGQLGGRLDYAALVRTLEEARARSRLLGTSNAHAGNSLPVQQATGIPGVAAHRPPTAVPPVHFTQNTGGNAWTGAAADGPQGTPQILSALHHQAMSAPAVPSRTAAALQRLSTRRSSAGGAGVPAGGNARDQGMRRISGGHHPAGSAAVLPVASPQLPGDITEAVPPVASVWEDDEAWRDQDAFARVSGCISDSLHHAGGKPLMGKAQMAY